MCISKREWRPVDLRDWGELRIFSGAEINMLSTFSMLASIKNALMSYKINDAFYCRYTERNITHFKRFACINVCLFHFLMNS